MLRTKIYTGTKFCVTAQYRIPSKNVISQQSFDTKGTLCQIYAKQQCCDMSLNYEIIPEYKFDLIAAIHE